MKKVLLIALLQAGISLCYGQKLVIDPVNIAATAVADSIERAHLNDINEATVELNGIEILLRTENEKLLKVTEKIQKGSTEINGALKNIEQLGFIYDKSKQIEYYMDKAMKTARNVNDPLLMVLAAKMQTKMAREGLNLVSYALQIVNTGSGKLLMNAGQRIDVLDKVLSEEKDLLKQVYHFYIVMKTAERIGAINYLLPSEGISVDTRGVAKQTLDEFYHNK